MGPDVQGPSRAAVQHHDDLVAGDEDIGAARGSLQDLDGILGAVLLAGRPRLYRGTGGIGNEKVVVVGRSPQWIGPFQFIVPLEAAGRPEGSRSRERVVRQHQRGSAEVVRRSRERRRSRAGVQKVAFPRPAIALQHASGVLRVAEIEDAGRGQLIDLPGDNVVLKNSLAEVVPVVDNDLSIEMHNAFSLPRSN